MKVFLESTQNLKISKNSLLAITPQIQFLTQTFSMNIKLNNVQIVFFLLFYLLIHSIFLGNCITYNDTINVIRSHQSLNFITCPVYIIYQVHNWKLQYYIIQKISMKGICPFQRPESVLIYSCCMRELGEGAQWFHVSKNGYTGHFCTEGSI